MCYCNLNRKKTTTSNRPSSGLLRQTSRTHSDKIEHSWPQLLLRPTRWMGRMNICGNMALMSTLISYNVTSEIATGITNRNSQQIPLNSSRRAGSGASTRKLCCMPHPIIAVICTAQLVCICWISKPPLCRIPFIHRFTQLHATLVLVLQRQC